MKLIRLKTTNNSPIIRQFNYLYIYISESLKSNSINSHSTHVYLLLHNYYVILIQEVVFLF